MKMTAPRQGRRSGPLDRRVRVCLRSSDTFTPAPLPGRDRLSPMRPGGGVPGALATG